MHRLIRKKVIRQVQNDNYPNAQQQITKNLGPGKISSNRHIFFHAKQVLR